MAAIDKVKIIVVGDSGTYENRNIYIIYNMFRLCVIELYTMMHD